MNARCHICTAVLRADYPLATHVADVHSDDAQHVTVIAAELRIPVVECDVDSIYASKVYVSLVARSRQ